MIKLSTIKPNSDNPRVIKDEDFALLVTSIKNFPKMMELRPIVVDENNIIKAGNQRLKALKEAGYKEIPEAWVKKAIDFTPLQLREFMLKDNSHAGTFEWEMLKSDFDPGDLVDWGIELPEDQHEDPPDKEQVSFVKTKASFIKIVFKNPKQLQKAEEEVKALVEKHKGAIYTVSAAGKA